MTGARRPVESLLEENADLSRFTTVRVGGRGRYLARPESEQEIADLLAWAGDRDLEIGVVGSGSNLLISDRGFNGLVLKLDGALTAIEHEGTVVSCGGGARLPSVAAKTAGWGLTGLEFGVNIPGTVGGAVRMNANAYGGELARVLREVTVCSSSGVATRRPDELGFRYRSSDLGDGEVVARAWFQLAPDDPEEIKSRIQDMRGRRREAQPSGIKTFGSTFKNPDPEASGGKSAGQLLDAAGCRGLEVGRARFSARHANFVENTGEASAADVLAVMAVGRRRVYEEFGIVLEPEVQLLGDVRWPAEWELGPDEPDESGEPGP